MENKYAFTPSSPTGQSRSRTPFTSFFWLFGLLLVGQSMFCRGQTGTTVAGGHGAGSNPDQLNNPTGIYVTSNGVVYIADYDNNRIQKWAVGATAGVTVAGGNNAGPNANQLEHPFGIYVDGSESIYIADASNHRIQKWVAGATAGVTVAGGNKKGVDPNQLDTPTGIYVTANGTLYIADFLNNRVQRWDVDAVSGVTVAGGHGEGGNDNQLRHPESVVVDEATGAVYVADTYNHRIQRWDVNASAGVTVAGGNQAGSANNQLNTPFALYRDSNGDIYVADGYNHRIQKFPAGSTSATAGVTVAGGHGAGAGAEQLATPEGVFLDDNKRIFVSDHANHRVQRFGTCLNPVATLDNEGTLTCLKPSIQLLAGSSIGGMTYTFSGPEVTNQSSNTAYATKPGQYTVVVLNPNNGCSSTATTDVSANTTPPQNVALTNNGPLSANNPTVTLTATNAPSTSILSYSFSTGASQKNGGTTATVTTSGTFSVTVTRSDNGCSASAPTTVLGANSPVACRGTSATINLTAAGKPSRYEWYMGVATGQPLRDGAYYQGTSTASLRTVSVSQSQIYYAKVYYADGSSAVYGPYRVTMNTGCGGREAASREPGESTPGESTLRITLMGNPMQGEALRALVEGAEGQSLQVELLNLSGQPVRTQSWASADSQQQLDWTLNGSPSGLYLLQVVSGKQRKSVKVVKP